MASSHDLVLTTVPGGNALSPFRAAALLARLRRVVPGLTAVSARHVHWVASEEPLDEATTATVERLLTYGPPDAGDADGCPPRHRRGRAPRLGTLSPWASKATDIAHNCGVDVRRVERVTEYVLATDEPLTEQQWGAAADLLHDRMTEAALPTRADAAALFDEREAEPMEHVDVLGRGRVAIEEADTAYGLALSRRRGRLPRRGVHRAAPQPHRRRADDVRAGQLRALPAQDLQRRLRRRRGRAAAVAVRDDPLHRGGRRARARSSPTRTTPR